MPGWTLEVDHNHNGTVLYSYVSGTSGSATHMHVLP